MNCYRSVLSRDGVRLHLAEAGNIAAPGVVFIHGTGSSHRIWQQQLSSSELQRFHLVAYDLRGHGQSDVPLADSSYQQGQHWADDLAAVIAATNIKQPVIVAWSYGGRTVCDYLRHYHGKQLAGINFIAAGTLAAPQALGPGYPVLHELFNPDLPERQLAEHRFAELLQLPESADPVLTELLLQDLQRVSLATRSAMRQRPLDYDDILAALELPVLLSHGLQDPIVKPVLAELLLEHLTNATVNWYPTAGHMPFLQQAALFNQQLAEFVEACQAQLRS